MSIYEEIIKALMGKIDSIEKFVLEQAPDVCKQLIKESFIKEVIRIAFCIITAFILFIGSLCCFDAASAPVEYFSDIQTCELIGCVFSGAAAMAFIIGLYCGIQNLVTIIVAPKVFLLRKCDSLLTKEKE